MLVRNRDRINGKRVVDLACANGKLSYPCLALGAREVVGVEARQSRIDEGQEFLKGTEFEDRIKFVQSDLLGYLEAQEPGRFDTILCFGFLYHTVRQVHFFRQMRRLAPETIIIDSAVVHPWSTFRLGRKGLAASPGLTLGSEDPEVGRNTFDSDGVILYPSAIFFEKMFDVIGYRHQRIQFDPREITFWDGIKDYKQKRCAAYIASRNS